MCQGSPPRVRGKLIALDNFRWTLRITPARAGKTHEAGAGHHRPEDHPRACGENYNPISVYGAGIGSPPRVRGKPSGKTTLRDVPRITPARAGKTTVAGAGGITATDHPRACGENSLKSLKAVASYGSPPRVRGKHWTHWTITDNPGITPARAGKTHAAAVSAARIRDHPRACGENVNRLTACGQNKGSPPRVRGKPSYNSSNRSSTRITPARAGKTRRAFWNRRTVRDHPRACGENSFVKFPIKMSLGSPPRVRGKPASSVILRTSERITPARAGKTYLHVR